MAVVSHQVTWLNTVISRADRPWEDAFWHNISICLHSYAFLSIWRQTFDFSLQLLNSLCSKSIFSCCKWMIIWPSWLLPLHRWGQSCCGEVSAVSGGQSRGAHWSGGGGGLIGEDGSDLGEVVDRYGRMKVIEGRWWIHRGGWKWFRGGGG